MRELNLDTVNRMVLRKQHLAEDSRARDVLRVADDICGLHATGTVEPYLSLFARMPGFEKGDLDQELYVDRSMVKMRCMRGTLHILTAEMAPMVHAATRAMVDRLSSRYAQFRGLGAERYPGVSQAIMEVVRGREMTPAQIKSEVGTDDNIAAAISLMCDHGLLARIGSRDNWRAKSYRYAIFAERYPTIDLARYGESEGVALLVHRYLRSYGPATVNDIAWWSGLSKRTVLDALEVIGGQTVTVGMAGMDGDFVMLRSDEGLLERVSHEGGWTVNLLPALDPYIMGYKERRRYLDHARYDQVFDRGGNATSTVLVDGRVVGVWAFVEGPEAAVRLTLFEEVEGALSRLIEERARQVGRFLAGGEVEVVEGASGRGPSRP